MGCLRMRQLIDEDRPAWGVFANMLDPAVAELAGYAGYDFVIADTEHSSMDFPTIENMLRAAGCVGISSIIRVPENNPKTILRAVELGPDAILVPHVRNASDARSAVEAARYWPSGDRGISTSTRVAQYGNLAGDFVSFAEQVNQELLVIALIEDESAVEDIENIAAVEGLDICFVGPADLAKSLGLMGTRNDAKLGRAIERVATGVKSVGRARFGIPTMHRNFELDSRSAVSLGARMITCGTDARMLLSAFSNELRRAKEML